MNDITSNRHGGNEQSQLAFERVRDELPQMRARVLRAIRIEPDGVGWTCRELANCWEIGMNAISGRFTELKRDGLIKKQGTRDGCAVWVAA